MEENLRLWNTVEEGKSLENLRKEEAGVLKLESLEVKGAELREIPREQDETESSMSVQQRFWGNCALMLSLSFLNKPLKCKYIISFILLFYIYMWALLVTRVRYDMI